MNDLRGFIQIILPTFHMTCDKHSWHDITRVQSYNWRGQNQYVISWPFSRQTIL